MHRKRFRPLPGQFLDLLALLGMPYDAEVDVVALSVRRRCAGLATALRAMSHALGGQPMLFDLWCVVDAFVGDGDASSAWRCAWRVTPSSPYGMFWGDGDAQQRTTPGAGEKNEHAATVRWRRPPLAPGPDALIRRAVGHEWRAERSGDATLWPSAFVAFFISTHQCPACAKARTPPAALLVAETEARTGAPTTGQGQGQGPVAARYDGREVTYAYGLLFTRPPG